MPLGQVSSGWSGPYFEAECEFGYVTSSHHPNSPYFLISDIEVKPEAREQGIGKGLLRLTLAEALKTDADFIIASIISKECLDAMRAVFGEASIKVDEEGTYGIDRSTSNSVTKRTLAFLKFPLR